MAKTLGDLLIERLNRLVAHRHVNCFITTGSPNRPTSRRSFDFGSRAIVGEYLGATS
jgi:hypothetical protein